MIIPNSQNNTNAILVFQQPWSAFLSKGKRVFELHTDNFAISSLRIKGSEFDKTNVYEFVVVVVVYQLNFQQFQATLGGNT